ncbi:SulP family inorganic anion transporter [Actinokineospora sp. 24-640]
MGAPRTSGPAHAPPPRRGPFRHWLVANARYDVPASLIVFLVAVPLSLGIAAASGAPVLAGLIAAVIGGVVAGLLGGAPLQVSGPAAGLTVVVAELISHFGWFATCAITVLAGVLQVVLGACRVGRAALAVSPTVVHAMLAGIGATIVLSQAHVLVGGTPGGSTWENVTSLPEAVLTPHVPSALLGLGVVALLLLWPRTPTAVRRVPGPLVAIALATVAALALAVDRVSLPSAPLSALHLPALPEGQWGAFAAGVLTMTLIASVESLLSAVAVSKLRPGARTDLNRELVGQGVANIASGMVGGLPVTGVIVRSSTNVRAGARTRVSAVLHGVWVLLFTVLLVGLVEQIPMAALAGLLVVVGAQLVDREHIRSALRHGELAVYLVTLSCVVFLDLLQGVLIGLACALLATLRRIVPARVRVEAGESDAEGRPTCSVVVEGTLSFLSVPRLSRVLAQVPEGSAVHLELVVDYLDHAAYDHIAAWRRAHEGNGGTVAVDEIGGPSPRSRRAIAGPTPRWFSPWSHWQRAQPAIPRQLRADDHLLRPLVTGAREYHRRGAPMLRPHLRRLADTQNPHAMFLTCADSRIMPNVITASGPGDLFTVRNIGNLVPDPRASGDLSVHAGVQYAVENLAVPVVMVCGHSRCGAMTAVHSGPADDPIGHWLRWADKSLAAWRDGHPLGLRAAAEGWSEVDQLAMVNVAVQLDTLRSLPVVARSGVRLVGLFFDIPSGTLLMLDEARGRFDPLPGKNAVLTAR